MLFGFIGRVSPAPALRDALDASAARSRGIADRVTKATLGNADGFALAATTAESAAGARPGPPVDVEAEMVSLADEQLRFEATAKLLQGAYQKVRLAMKSDR
jgi:flagellar basal body rod protein FlgB